MSRCKLILLYVLIIILWLSGSALVHGQTSVIDLQHIQSLGDILAIAIVTDRSIQLTDMQIQEVVHSIQSLQAALRPQIHASVDYKCENLANNPIGGLYSLRGMDQGESIHTRSASITMVQQVGLNNQLRTAFAKSQLGFEAGVMQKEQAIINLMTAIQGYYHGIIQAYNSLALAELALDHAAQNLEFARQKEGDGVVTPLDVLREQSHLMTTQNQMQAAQNGLNVALFGLLQIVGLDFHYLEQGQEWVATLLESVEQQPPVAWDILLDTAVAQGLAERVELRMLATQKQLAELDYQAFLRERDWTANVAARYLYNDLVMQASFDSNQRVTGTLFTTKTDSPALLDVGSDWEDADWFNDLPAAAQERWREIFDQIEDSIAPGFGDERDGVNPWQITLGFTYRFGDGGAKRVEDERLQQAVEKANLQYQRAQDGVYLEIYALHQQLTQAWQSYELHLLLVEEAEQTLVRLQQMYDHGFVTAKDLLEGDLFVKMARNDLRTAALKYQEQQTKLAVAMGVSVPVLIQGIVSGQW